MRTLWLSLFLSAALGAIPNQSSAGETRAAQILDRFEHANQWRDHVMI
ncbi:MAG: glycerophosphodiester phosphodiesterase, partial [Mesorhizobium sp.]